MFMQSFGEQTRCIMGDVPSRVNSCAKKIGLFLDVTDVYNKKIKKTRNTRNDEDKELTSEEYR